MNQLSRIGWSGYSLAAPLGKLQLLARLEWANVMLRKYPKPECWLHTTRVKFLRRLRSLLSLVVPETLVVDLLIVSSWSRR